ncbi:MAG: adenosylmethionine decarboxylase [Actinobacteria bacterium]|nr:adenosylmethionine decarboxylase [Actinomycetota bacterium]
MLSGDQGQQQNNRGIVHILADFWGCNYTDDAEVLLKTLQQAANAANAQIVGSTHHQFQPFGSTALLLLAESHMSIHTWPEHDYLAIDVFTCGDQMDPEVAVDYLEKNLGPTKTLITRLMRGQG